MTDYGKVAAVSIRDEGGRVVVTGPYNDMKDVYPKLKTRGFSYDSSNRSWWIDAKKLTPAKRKNLEELVHGKGAPKAAPTPENKDAERQRWRDLAKEMFNTKLFHIRVVQDQPYFFILHFTGDTYSVRDVFKSHGATWESPGWDLDLSKVPEAKVRDLFKDLERASISRAVHNEMIKKQIDTKTWPTLEVTLRLDLNGLVLIQSRKTNSKLKELVAKYFEGASLTQGEWRIAPYNVQEGNLKRFEAEMGELESEVAAKPPDAAPVAQPHSEGRIPNRKTGPCRRCRGLVAPGDGWLIQRFDDDDEKIIYEVEHKDRATCEANLEMAKVIREKGQNRTMAKANLRKLISKPENFQDAPASGYLDMPSGKQIQLEPSGYGGGVSVVIEPGEHHVWFVQGNSADGDDWGRNNIGGHSMGWRTELTDEIKTLIEVAVDEKFWSA